MTEYIDRELAENIFWEEQQELLKWTRYHQFDKDEKEEYDRLEDYQDKIKALPIADVVEVVRCKDCRHIRYLKHAEVFSCMFWNTHRTYETDFCSYGEKRSE